MLLANTYLLTYLKLCVIERHNAIWPGKSCSYLKLKLKFHFHWRRQWFCVFAWSLTFDRSRGTSKLKMETFWCLFEIAFSAPDFPFEPKYLSKMVSYGKEEMKRIWIGFKSRKKIYFEYEAAVIRTTTIPHKTIETNSRFTTKIDISSHMESLNFQSGNDETA